MAENISTTSDLQKDILPKNKTKSKKVKLKDSEITSDT